MDIHWHNLQIKKCLSISSYPLWCSGRHIGNYAVLSPGNNRECTSFECNANWVERVKSTTHQSAFCTFRCVPYYIVHQKSSQPMIGDVLHSNALQKTCLADGFFKLALSFPSINWERFWFTSKCMTVHFDGNSIFVSWSAPLLKMAGLYWGICMAKLNAH